MAKKKNTKKNIPTTMAEIDFIYVGNGKRGHKLTSTMGAKIGWGASGGTLIAASLSDFRGDFRVINWQLMQFYCMHVAYGAFVKSCVFARNAEMRKSYEKSISSFLEMGTHVQRIVKLG